MLNLFAYGNDDEDEDQTKESQQQNQDATVDQPSTSEKSPVSLQSKTKKTKQRKVLNIEKITGVSKSELLNQDDEEENDQNKSKQSAFASDKGSLSGSDSTKSSKPESGAASNGGDIPLNPFLSNPDPGASTESEKDDSSETPYKIIYRLPPTSASEPKAAPQAASAHAPITTGYGASYSQSQYEAFMRQSGMLESANAESTSALEFLGENIKCYDKNMIRAFKEGSVIELDQNSIHNHMEQPGSEYWERKEKRAKIAEQFGKYAHIAPTQLQQTRNQISYLATKAIDDLMDLDKRRAHARKTRKEIRAKYGW